jgi:hypothetical protein
LLAIDGSTGLGLQLGQYSADGTGLVVLHVDSAGVAGKAGVIKVGDVVLNVNGMFPALPSRILTSTPRLFPFVMVIER